jgi:hypothetical protein
MKNFNEILKDAGYASCFDKRNKKYNAINHAIENGFEVFIVEKGFVNTLKNGKKYNLKVKFAKDGKFCQKTSTITTNSHYEDAFLEYALEFVIYLNNTQKDFIQTYIKQTADCTCDKCNGTGYLPQFHYFADGICFQCMGVGVKKLHYVTD